MQTRRDTQQRQPQHVKDQHPPTTNVYQQSTSHRNTRSWERTPRRTRLAQVQSAQDGFRGGDNARQFERWEIIAKRGQWPGRHSPLLQLLRAAGDGVRGEARLWSRVFRHIVELSQSKR
jgi:hypothetical protein